MRVRPGSPATPSPAPDGLDDVVASAIGGDERSFEALWSHFNPRLTKFVQARTYNSNLDYEEIISETWTSVAKDIRKFSGGKSDFSGWIYAIARNRIIDASRRRDKLVHPTHELEEVFWLPSPQNIEKDFEGSERISEILEAIRTLPEAQAEIVLLRVVSDLSVEETAKVVKKNPNSVRVLSHRGLVALREKLGGSNG